MKSSYSRLLSLLVLSLQLSMQIGALCPAARRLASTASKSLPRLTAPTSRAYSASSHVQEQSKTLVPVAPAVGPLKETYPHLGFRSQSERQAQKVYEQRWHDAYQMDPDLALLSSEKEERTRKKALALEALRTDKYPEMESVRAKMEGTERISEEARLAKAEQIAERLTELSDRHPDNKELGRLAAHSRKNALQRLEMIYPLSVERIFARKENRKPKVEVKQQQSRWYELAIAEDAKAASEWEAREKERAKAFWEAEKKRPLTWHEQQKAKEAAEKQKRETLKRAQEEAAKKEQSPTGWRAWLKRLW